MYHISNLSNHPPLSPLSFITPTPLPLSSPSINPSTTTISPIPSHLHRHPAPFQSSPTHSLPPTSQPAPQTVAVHPNNAHTSTTSTKQTNINVSPHRRRKRNRLQYRAAPNAVPISDVKPLQYFLGVVRDVGPADSAWLDINVATSTGRSVRARLRLTRKSRGGGSGHHPSAKASYELGAIVPVHVCKIDAAAARIEVLPGSPPQQPQQPTDHNEKPLRKLDDLHVGEKLSNVKVLSVGTYGALLDVDVYRPARKQTLKIFPALLPHRHFPPSTATSADAVRRSDVQRILSPGDFIDAVWVRVVYPLSPFLLVDGVEVDKGEVEREAEEREKGRRRRGRRVKADQAVVGEERRGIVREVAKFGVFVDMGYSRDGLLHYSEMGEGIATQWRERLVVGTEVDVEIVKQEGGLIALRLVAIVREEVVKAVERATGALAREGDVERAEELVKKVKRFRHGRRMMVEEDEELLQGWKKGKVGQDIMRKVKGRVEEDEDEAEEEEDEAEEEEDEAEEEIEKFSDEYFEDRYGM